MTADKTIRVGIIGASGYTGADVIRLAARHPGIELSMLVAKAHAGQALGDVFPHLGQLENLKLIDVADCDFGALDAVFCGLPHGTAHEIIASLPNDLRVIDMSADFRLRDAAVYASWYGGVHGAPELLGEAVYGLSEHYAREIAGARLVACPGCYPTATLLALLPLASDGLIDATDIIIDAKSGVSGAGRSVKQGTLFAEVGEGVAPYGVAAHRHAPEIEQELSRAAGSRIIVNFTPHMVPMSRGELVTCYVRLAENISADDLRAALTARYRGSPFVQVVAEGKVPATQHVRGSNGCLIAVFADRVPGRAIVIAAIDNLVKGSAGQALQNFNLMFGFAEDTGLEQLPLFP
jgi:N-acetyl-gamma-glutamyl-phosphate reductase